VASGGGEKTEKATPKRRDDARKKGQVARSADVNGAVVLLVAFGVLAISGPMMLGRMQGMMRDGLSLVATPDVVGWEGLAELFGAIGTTVAVVVGPIALAGVLAGTAASVLQVKWKPSAEAIKPDPKRLNPLSGAKNIFGKKAPFEAAKAITKVVVVGAVVAWSLVPDLPQFVALVGLPPALLLAKLAKLVLVIAFKAVAAYLLIAAADYAWQRYTHEKQLRMSVEEVKQEMKNSQVSAEIRSAQRQRQRAAARARMMADVPEADVVVTNPTHYAVALRYDSEKAAPVVVAKGKDLIAARIRQIAAEHDVPVIADPPLARSLHASVEVGRMIPEELYHAVAQLLAFVYRTAGRRRRALGAAA
jgi:flagellar biosynthesis protein FlhB